MSKADGLAKLVALRKSGLLTRKAFNAEKAKLLVESLPPLQSCSPQPVGAESPQGAGWWQASETGSGTCQIPWRRSGRLPSMDQWTTRES